METEQAKTESQNQGGRPTKKTDLTLKKLEEAFAWGCTDKEACLYAGISEKTLYNYQNNDEEFLQRKELLKQLPILKVRSAVVNALEDDPNLALRFLERKKKDEFSTKIETNTHSEGSLAALARAAWDLNQKEAAEERMKSES